MFFFLFFHVAKCMVVCLHFYSLLFNVSHFYSNTSFSSCLQVIMSPVLLPLNCSRPVLSHWLVRIRWRCGGCGNQSIVFIPFFTPSLLAFNSYAFLGRWGTQVEFGRLVAKIVNQLVTINNPGLLCDRVWPSGVVAATLVRHKQQRIVLDS